VLQLMDAWQTRRAQPAAETAVAPSGMVSNAPSA